MVDPPPPQLVVMLKEEQIDKQLLLLLRRLRVAVPLEDDGLADDVRLRQPVRVVGGDVKQPLGLRALLVGQQREIAHVTAVNVHGERLVHAEAQPRPRPPAAARGGGLDERRRGRPRRRVQAEVAKDLRDGRDVRGRAHRGGLDRTQRARLQFGALGPPRAGDGGRWGRRSGLRLAFFAEVLVDGVLEAPVDAELGVATDAEVR